MVCPSRCLVSLLMPMNLDGVSTTICGQTFINNGGDDVDQLLEAIQGAPTGSIPQLQALRGVAR